MNKGILQSGNNHKCGIKYLVLPFFVFLLLLPYPTTLSAQLEKGSATIFLGKKKNIVPTILWNLDDKAELIKTSEKSITLEAIVKSNYRLTPTMFALYKNGVRVPGGLSVKELSAAEKSYKYKITPTLKLGSQKEKFYIDFTDGDMNSKSYEIAVLYEKENQGEVVNVQEELAFTLLNPIGVTDKKNYLLKFSSNKEVVVNIFQNNIKKDLSRLSQKTLSEDIVEYTLPMVLAEGNNEINLSVGKINYVARSETINVLYKTTNSKDKEPKETIAVTPEPVAEKTSTWDKIQAESIPIKKIELVEQYLKSGELEHKQLSCKLFENLIWDESVNQQQYNLYFEKLAWFLDSCPHLKEQVKERALPPLHVVSNCEGVNCEVQIEHFIPPLDKSNFTISEGAEIVSIQENKVSFKLNNPKDKFEVSYSDKIARSDAVYLGLEDYFNIHFFELNKKTNELILDITGGTPPLFIQLLSEGKLLNEFNLNKFKEGIIPLNKASILPNQSIEVYVTDANKRTNKLVMEFISADKDSIFSGPILLILVLAAFLLTCLFMFWKYQQAKNKTKEWDDIV